MKKQTALIVKLSLALAVALLASNQASAQMKDKMMDMTSAKKSAEKMAGKHGAMVVLTTTDGSNKVIGAVGFSKKGDKVQVKGMFAGLTPGKHGFHVHQVGDCGPKDGTPGGAAGPHFNPTSMEHGSPAVTPHHAGDLGNIEAGADGKAKVEMSDSMLALDGPNSVVGHAVMVHAGTDDLKSQPAGNAGGRFACGVVMMAQSDKK